MKLLALFLSGFIVGISVSWLHIHSLKARLRIYESYIHDRIDTQFKGTSAEREAAPDAAPVKAGNE